jgi:iron complex transport system ATP-binding protein
MMNGNSPPTAAALRYESVSFAYGAAAVLRDVSLRVDQGEMVALLGPNGAGKSTLLKLASGVLRPQRGRVLLGLEDAHRLPRAQAARQVAVVPQDFSVQFAYTVRQLVELGRTAYLGAWGALGAGDRGAVATALRATHLAGLADRVFNELSGGERQRVLVAIALAQTSGTVLLDEPTAHLDIRHQVDVLELLRRQNQQEGLTVVAAIHDLNLAARYFPRLILFDHGIVADGPPTAVLDSALLSSVYRTPVQVGILRGEEHLSIMPPGHDDARPQGNGSVPQRAGVHVLAGGGSGELAMRALADAGIPFTAGALNVGDSDHALASRLGLECIEEPPYAPISKDGVEATRAGMAAAGAVLICPAPMGPGNVALFEAALEVARTGQRIIVLEHELSTAGSALADDVVQRARTRDFTGGRATAVYSEVLSAGAQVVGTPAALVDKVREIAERPMP